jgi:hypothetical protein
MFSRKQKGGNIRTGSLVFLEILAVSACLIMGACKREKPAKKENAILGVSNLAKPEVDFKARFPNAENVEWDTLAGDGFMATFSDGKADCHAQYDTSGLFLYNAVFVEASTLPLEAQKYLTQKYPESSIALVVSVEKLSGFKGFQVELETASKYVNIEFDSAGKVIEEFSEALDAREMREKEEEGVEDN